MQLLPLQMCIAGVVLLGLLESTAWYTDYIGFNRGGSRGITPVVIAVSISTVRKTVSRLLVLTASGMCGLLVWLTMYERCSATTRLERGRARVAVPPPAAPVQTYSYVMGTSDEVGYVL